MQYFKYPLSAGNFLGDYLIGFFGAAMNQLACAFVLLLYSNSVMAQSIYRCGNTFQQAPCDGEGSGVITLKETISSTAGAESPKHKTPQGLKDEAFNRFYLQGLPAVGMSVRQLEQVMGMPAHANAAGNKSQQQYEYEKDGRRVFVQVRDGVVTAVRHRSAKASKAARKKAASDCPTALEVRNAKVAANSLTLSAKERIKRLKEVEKMERCGKGA